MTKSPANEWDREYLEYWSEILNKGGNHVYFYQLKGIIADIRRMIFRLLNQRENEARLSLLSDLEEGVDSLPAQVRSDGVYIKRKDTLSLINNLKKGDLCNENK